MMTNRILPPDEWPRLEGTPLGLVWHSLKPEGAKVVVVEQDGAIVGAWAVVLMVHVEGLWIAPEQRRSAAVGRRLLQTMQDTARGFGADAVWTGAESDDVRRLLSRAGAFPVPFDSYILPIPAKDTVCQPS